MARVEVVHLDTAGNADRPAILCKHSGDQVVWICSDGPFNITFPTGSPFASSSFYVPAQGSVNSGAPTGTPGQYTYHVRHAAAAGGDDGEVVINP